ncbi:MAG TPA: amidohydrolase family protein [Pyrinomonadaceae bacterium]|nr:amidohydrolase family protein [Pyrinomonadaceae bacterium]
MTTIYCAPWVLPVSSPPISDAAVAIKGDLILGVGHRAPVLQRFPDSKLCEFPSAAILPGLINTHSHLEITAMRGFLEPEEDDFFAWLRKLTRARVEGMTDEDLYVSAAWGACEAARAGVTCLGDAGDSGRPTINALRDIGLRGTVYQESFGPEPWLAKENLAKLQTKVDSLRGLETSRVRVGVSPHSPYAVCGTQLRLISEFALVENLPLMIHAAESVMERMLLKNGTGVFAEILTRKGIDWRAPSVSTIQYLADHGVLETRPLLAHCINIDSKDIEIIRESGSTVAHCPKSNAKLGHGRAPLAKLLEQGVTVGLGSDSVASNNTCDILEEARFAVLSARAAADEDRASRMLVAKDGLEAATIEGARALGLSGVVGELKEGLQADLIAVSVTGAHQLPLYDPVNTLIFASSAHDVVLTVVAGREVFREGLVTAIDEEELAQKVQDIARRLQSASYGAKT